MAEQVAIRLRKAHKKTTSVAISVGFSHTAERSPIHVQRKVDPTQNTKVLIGHVISLFRSKYNGGAVRNIAVRYNNFVYERYAFISLFYYFVQVLKEEKLEITIYIINSMI